MSVDFPSLEEGHLGHDKMSMTSKQHPSSPGQ